MSLLYPRQLRNVDLLGAISGQRDLLEKQRATQQADLFHNRKEDEEEVRRLWKEVVTADDPESAGSENVQAALKKLSELWQWQQAAEKDRDTSEAIAVVAFRHEKVALEELLTAQSQLNRKLVLHNGTLATQMEDLLAYRSAQEQRELEQRRPDDDDCLDLTLEEAKDSVRPWARSLRKLLKSRDEAQTCCHNAEFHLWALAKDGYSVVDAVHELAGAWRELAIYHVQGAVRAGSKAKSLRTEIDKQMETDNQTGCKEAPLKKRKKLKGEGIDSDGQERRTDGGGKRWKDSEEGSGGGADSDEESDRSGPGKRRKNAKESVDEWEGKRVRNVADRGKRKSLIVSPQSEYRETEGESDEDSVEDDSVTNTMYSERLNRMKETEERFCEHADAERKTGDRHRERADLALKLAELRGKVAEDHRRQMSAWAAERGAREFAVQLEKELFARMLGVLSD